MGEDRRSQLLQLEEQIMEPGSIVGLLLAGMALLLYLIFLVGYFFGYQNAKKKFSKVLD